LYRKYRHFVQVLKKKKGKKKKKRKKKHTLYIYLIVCEELNFVILSAKSSLVRGDFYRTSNTMYIGGK